MMERRYINAVEGKKDGVYQDRNLMVRLHFCQLGHLIKRTKLDMDLDEEKVAPYSMAVHAGGHDS